MARLLTSVVALVAGLATGPAVAGHTDDPAEDPGVIRGIWVTADGEGFIEITETDGVYEGTVIGGAGDTERFDENNPDPALRDRPLLGLTIMTGFRFQGDGTWTDGRIYDPNNGKTYRCKMKLATDGTLKVRGYVGISWFGRTETWTRMTDE